MYYKNGAYFGDNSQTIQVSDRGFLLADGLFETVYIKNKTPVLLHDHYMRLKSAAMRLKIRLEFTVGELDEVAKKLIADNFSKEAGTGSLRLTLTRGSGPRGIGIPSETFPTLLVTASPLHAPADTPISLFISSIRRNEYSPLAGIKSLSYLDNILAREEAIKNGAAEAIMLNTHEKVACVTTGNIFIINQAGGIQTPSLASGILPGITRKHVIALCKQNGISIEEKKISCKELKHAGDIFITNSIIGIRKAYISGHSQKNNNQSPNMLNRIKKLYMNFLDDMLQHGYKTAQSSLFCHSSQNSTNEAPPASC